MSVLISSDNKTIISASADKTIKIWDRKSGKVLNTFMGHNGSVNSLAFSSNERMIVSGSNDKTIKIWNKENGKLYNMFLGHKDNVNTTP